MDFWGRSNGTILKTAISRQLSAVSRQQLAISHQLKFADG